MIAQGCLTEFVRSAGNSAASKTVDQVEQLALVADPVDPDQDKLDHWTAELRQRGAGYRLMHIGDWPPADQRQFHTWGPDSGRIVHIYIARRGFDRNGADALWLDPK